MTEILLIEDDEDVRAVVRRMLETLGHEVCCACDGDEGIAMFRDNPTLHVITDMIMPGKEGLETIGELRAVNPEVRILAISGGGRTLQAAACLQLAGGMGADATLAKPFDLDQLTDALVHLTEDTPRV